MTHRCDPTQGPSRHRARATAIVAALICVVVLPGDAVASTWSGRPSASVLAGAAIGRPVPATGSAVGGEAAVRPAGLRAARRSVPKTVARPYFPAADWLWTPVPAAPIIDAGSARIVPQLASGLHSAALRDYAVTRLGPRGIDAGTPRSDVRFANQGTWGPDPFGADRMPIPTGTPVPPGSDAMITVADPVTGWAYGLWQAGFDPATRKWSASWGGRTRLDGDGRDVAPNGSGTGSGVSRYAGLISVAEMASAKAGDVDAIRHALVFSTDMSARSSFRFPATKTDGVNQRGVSDPLPEGARIQLDPAVDLSTLGLNPAERAVARALQRYGAYNIDNGAASAAFVFEYEAGASPGPTYKAAGMAWDYYDFARIPWNRLRVLATWNGR